jgi:DNA modification methylase
VLGEFAIKNRRIPMDKDNVKIEFNLKNEGYRAGSTIIYYPNKNRFKMWERTTHPTQKPIAMYELFVNAYCDPKGIVLDPFAGSGTTGLACKKQNREYILIEKEEKYYTMIKDRLNA